MGKHLKCGSGRSYGDGHGTGYCNPPGPRWEKGQSGNPSGVRKKGERAPEITARDRVVRDMDDLLALSHQIGGEELTFSQIMLRRIASEASGDAKLAIKFLNILLAQRGERSTQNDVDLDDMTDDERLIMDAAKRRCGIMHGEEGEVKGPAQGDGNGE